MLPLLASLLREGDAFFILAPRDGRVRLRSPITEKGGQVATGEHKTFLTASRGRRRYLEHVSVMHFAVGVGTAVLAGKAVAAAAALFFYVWSTSHCSHRDIRA